MSEKSMREHEQKLADAKMKANRDKILEGIVDTSKVSKASFFAVHCGARFVLEEELDEFQKKVYDAIAGAQPLITFQTFSWSGERNDKMLEFTSHMQPQLILEITEVTEDMWYRFITETADRATMAKMNAGGGGPQGILN